MRLNDRSPRRRLRGEDRGVAAVIGMALVLALLITAYSNAVRTEVPAFGAAAEERWDTAIAETFRDLSGSFSDGLTSSAPLATNVPPPPEAKALDVPFMGRREPAAPSGSLSFDPSCSTLTATHTLADGTVIEDLRRGAMGCLEFRSETIYTNAFAYRVELGGVLRLQDDRAVVLNGPPIEIDASSPSVYRVSLGIPGLRGDASTVTVSANSVRIDLVPGPHAGEIEQSPNAGSAVWRMETPYPDAWKTWFAMRFAQAGFVASRASPAEGHSAADYTLVCDPIDCSRGANGLGALIISIEGPRTDSDDLKLSATYSIFDVNVR